MNVLFVSHNFAKAEGTGGHHRVLQILEDLRRIVPPQCVTHLSLRQWAQDKPEPEFHRIQRVHRRVVRRLKRLLALQGYEIADLQRMNAFVAAYRDMIAQQRPHVCFVDHPCFERILDINAQHGIATISVTQNFEVFTLFDLEKESMSRIFRLFASEVEFLSRCTARICISKTEMSFLNGIGVASSYYPYLPTGSILTSFEEIRAKRERIQQQEGFFLVLGSANHPPTRAGFQWFLSNLQANGLPSKIKVIIAGRGTERLEKKAELPGNVEMQGWLKDHELSELLTRVQAVLVPHIRGFGALTRLAELPAAGVPVITTEFAAQAIDIPPGITVLSNEWRDWQIELNRARPSLVPRKDYKDWYVAQLEMVNENLLPFLS